ncbi:unnamed protein product [Trichobilharzia regenti]|nr:unnamed protein product [Trichobilharzia regenti]
MDNLSSNSNETTHPNQQKGVDGDDESNKLQIFKPMRKQRRLRSISGSHSDVPMTKQYSSAFPNTTNQTIISHYYCKHQSLLNSSDLLVYCPTEQSSSPVVYCQTICPDEASFQAHFTGHLRGHLPGDLTELFNPYSPTQSLTTVPGGTITPTVVDTTPTLSTIPPTTTSTTPIVVNSTPVVVQPIMDNSPEISQLSSSSSSITYNPSSSLLAKYSSIHQNNNNNSILSGSSTNDNFHVEIMDVQSSLGVGDQCQTLSNNPPSRINPHSEMVQPSSSIDNNQPIVVVAAAAAAGDVSNSSSCFNQYIHQQHHHEQQQQQQQFNGLPNSPSLFSNDDDDAASISTLSEAFKSDSHTVVVVGGDDDNVAVVVGNNFSTVSNNETGKSFSRR